MSYQLFKNKLQEIKWSDILAVGGTNTVYEPFLNKFTSLYDKWFPENVTVNKKKTLNNLKLSKSLVYQLRTCEGYNKNKKMWKNLI